MSIVYLDLSINPDDSVKELERLFPGSQDVVLELLRDIRDDMQKDALGAFQTSVPVYTRQLRDQMIEDKEKRSSKAPGFTISISTRAHTNTPGRKKPTGAQLADILDNGYSEKTGAKLFRRKNAVAAFTKITSIAPPAKGRATADWIGKAIKAFEKAIDGF
jgi:hypothetical protein